jgi:hypothetical protein
MSLVHRIEKKRSSKHKVEEPTLLGILESKKTFAEKVELIRSVNPHFYLLTPKPKQKEIK